MVAVATRNQYVANVISHIKWTVYNDGVSYYYYYYYLSNGYAIRYINNKIFLMGYFWCY